MSAEHRRTFRPSAACAVLLALAVLLGCAPASPTPPPPEASSLALGFSPGGSFVSEDPARLEQDMGRMAAVGARMVRLDIDWSRIEARENSFDWTATDRAVAAARRAGLEVVGLVAYTPAWARPPGTTDKWAPTDPAAFARFAALTARRYRDDVAVWEIWNEPNIATFWRPAPDPVRYATLLTPTARLLRAVQPHATVLTGGLSGVGDEPTHVAPTTFVDSLYRSGAGGSFDGVSVHPYPRPATSIVGTAAQFDRLTMLRRTLVRNGGEGVGVWITEIGAPTSSTPDGVTPTQQATLVRDVFAMARARPWVRSLLVYSFRDVGRRPENIQQNFGLRYFDDTPKPAWFAFRDAARSR